MNAYGFLILAAGSSSRLGEPKQLLTYHHKTLLQHAIDNATAVNKGPVFAVLGAYADLIEKEVALTGVQILINETWQEGMGSTISYGVRRMLDVYPQLNGLIIAVCDQPLITPLLLRQLIQTHEEKQKGIVACAYGETLGTPVLFERRFFNHLQQLKGHEGAKRIILQHQEEVAAIPFPGGNIDIDTVADYEQLMKE